MDFEISKMSIEDLKSIKNILSSNFDNFWSYDVLEDELECDNSYVIVAKNSENIIVGFGGLKVILDEANIMNIVVKKDFRHHGIGSLLLENLINYSKNINLKIPRCGEFFKNDVYAFFKEEKSGSQNVCGDRCRFFCPGAGDL